jgi:threonine dehydratase
MTNHSLADVLRARQVVQRHLPPTPLLRNQVLSERYGCDLWIKYENCSPIRSFKARGGLYRLATLDASYAGVATASTGNHGQGIAFGARAFGRRAVVVVPVDANPLKVEAIRALGADLRVAGKDLLESNEIAKEIAAQENLLYVEDGEDPAVMIGCATLALELLEQMLEFDDLIVPVGGGNLLGACALVLREASSPARLHGVQSSAAPAVHDSFLAGKTVKLELCETFAGGLATAYPGSYTFDYVQRGVTSISLVSDEELVDGAIELFRATGHLPEGAGAAAFAGLRSRADEFRGRRVVIVLSGSNAEQRIWDRAGG